MDPFAHARPNWSQSALVGQKDSIPLAATAPVLQIYEEAVQDPRVECTNLDALYSQAQLDDTDRYDARILREDFCSTAIIAATWLSLDSRNESQGVDIDLVALRATQRRLCNREESYVQLLQSPGFSGGEATQVLDSEIDTKSFHSTPSACTDNEQRPSTSDTWAAGAATERFDRKRNKKLAKATKKAAANARSANVESSPKKQGPRLQLLHSDVLDLPVPPLKSAPSTSTSALNPPDLIASLNYAMAYFHDRATLLRYLTMAKNTLRPRTGVFVTDMFGGPPTGETYPDQDETWARFQNEVGFGRDGGDGRNQTILLADQSHKKSKIATNGHADSDSEDEEPTKVLEVMPAPPLAAQGTRAEWPRGKLKLVRKGTEHGGFEYWREDGPVDWMTNRFRMSLSFRFSDASWLRDVFHYDFRIWSIKELVEAMEEVGFVRVRVHILPRNIVDDDNVSELDRSRPASPVENSKASQNDDHDSGLADMAQMMRRTEKQEQNKSVYRDLEPGEKVFASRSFGTYIIACAP